MEEDTGGRLVRALPTSQQAPRGSLNHPSAAGLPAPAAGGSRRRRGRRRRGPLQCGVGGLAGRERAEGGQLIRQERRGVDKGGDGRLPTPPVRRKGHPEPAINDRGFLEVEWLERLEWQAIGRRCNRGAAGSDIIYIYIYIYI